MLETDPPPIYHPWQLPNAPMTDPAFTLYDPFMPVVPAHDLPRALAWSVARAFRINAESCAIPVQGYGIPSSSGGGAMPPEAAVFDLTAITLEDEPENRTLDLNRQTPGPFSPDLGAPQICQPQAIILSVSVSHPDGGIAEGDFLTDLLVSGHAGDQTALAAFTAGGWRREAGWFRNQQSELSDLICQVLWDPTLTNADDEDRKRYRDRIHAEIGRLMHRAEAAGASASQAGTPTQLASIFMSALSTPAHQRRKPAHQPSLPPPARRRTPQHRPSNCPYCRSQPDRRHLLYAESPNSPRLAENQHRRLVNTTPHTQHRDDYGNHPGTTRNHHQTPGRRRRRTRPLRRLSPLPGCQSRLLSVRPPRIRRPPSGLQSLRALRVARPTRGRCLRPGRIRRPHGTGSAEPQPQLSDTQMPNRLIPWQGDKHEHSARNHNQPAVRRPAPL